MYVAIDPGKNIGLATFSSEGEDRGKLVVNEEALFGFLKNVIVAVEEKESRFVTFILEDYKLRKDRALDQVGSDIPAARIIGAVQMVHSILGEQSKIVLQEPRILHTALKWSRQNKWVGRKSHVPDDVSAYAHGVYYLIQQKIRPHPIDAQ